MDLVHLTLLACAVVAAVLVVRYDLYEREPWPMLLGAASAGGTLTSSIGSLKGGAKAEWSEWSRPSPSPLWLGAP